MKTIIRKFEKNRYSANQYCPCGKSNNDGKFATEKGFKNQFIGHCHGCLKDFWKDSGTLVPLDKYSAPRKVDLMPEYYVEQSFSNHENIDFIKFLVNEFGTSKTEEIISKYYLCGSTKNSGAVIFWQIDKNKKVRTGKVMDYNPDSGKRIGYPSWVHSFAPDYSLKQCFFGEHLIQIDKPVAIVESEKAACILSVCNPAFTWIASGGSSGLNQKKCGALRGYDVTLFPDHGKYREWQKRASEIGLKCAISIEAEKWFEKGLIGKGEAIDDYYLNLNKQVKSLNLERRKIDPEWEPFYNQNKDCIDVLSKSR